jgi:L-amino acid N-acyltransferase YncA
VRADNPTALAAYKSEGFEIVGTARRHAKIDGRYIDKVLIEKWLGSSAGLTEDVLRRAGNKSGR